MSSIAIVQNSMTKKKKAPNRNPITFAKAALRGAFRKWYAGNIVVQRCRVSRGKYKCEGCGAILKRTDLQIDHIEPVVDIKTGFTTIEQWIIRLLVPPEKLQMLCHFERDTGQLNKKGKKIMETWGCHPSKTSLESELRKFYKEDIKVKKVTKKKK